jgi:MFS family permease
MSAFNGLHRPALESMVQQIVPREDFPTVSALGSFKYSVGMIIGPAVGGLLIAHAGLVVTYLADMATFVVALISLMMMTHIPKPKVEANEGVMTSLLQGLRYALSRQELMGSYTVDFVAMIFGMPTALFPAMAQAFGGASTLGFLYSAPAVGALVISIFSGWFARIKRHGAAIAVSASLWGVAIIGFGLSANLALALFFLALAGGFDTISGIFRGTMWNEMIPNHLRGRMAGIEMISYLSGPKLGDSEASLVAAAFGITASVVSGGVLCVVGVAACCAIYPRFWRYRSPG